MTAKISPAVRNSIASAFRERVCEKLDVVPFAHQRAYWAASDGMILLDVPDPSGARVMVPASELRENESVDELKSISGTDWAVVRRMLAPRQEGHARFLSDLGAFKIGKSFGAALWASGFAIVPNRRIKLVGIEYDLCEPEFSYLVEFLLSERGMGMKAKSVTNRPRNGDMFLELENGTRYEARSWERKDSLKGKEDDLYIYCEAYQLPGIECFTSFSQNLRARQGFALFPTTPDRPWIKELHELGHGKDPEWFCVCSVGAETNPFTFDAKAKARDVNLMTREKYAIHYEGKLGDFVGRVFNYQRGERQFTAGDQPDLFASPLGDRASLTVPEGWELVGGADTGTYYTALLVAFAPNGDAFVLEEFPNYRYVAGLPERDEGITIPQWAGTVTLRSESLGHRGGYWADQNSQFKRELINYGIPLLANKHTRESRTEVTREYFEHHRVFLAPWLQVLPFELENASWPEEASASGRFERVKDRDHTLDCLEHILSRRPVGRPKPGLHPQGRWADQFKPKSTTGNVHLGKN